MSRRISHAFHRRPARVVTAFLLTCVCHEKERAQQRATEAAATQAQAPQARHARRDVKGVVQAFGWLMRLLPYCKN